MDPQVQALMERLRLLHTVFQTNMAERARQFDMTATQAAVAETLRDHPNSTLHEVCDRLGWPKSTVSRVVDELVTRGLVKREIPASNRRTVLLSLQHGDHCLPARSEEVFPGGAPDQEELQTILQTLDRLLTMLKKPE